MSRSTADDQQQLSSWLELTQTAIQQLDPQFAVVQAFWKQGVRSDGRLFSQALPVVVEHAVLTCAAGSARVRVGSDCLVLAATTLQVGQPAAAAPNQGDVVITVVSARSSSINIPKLQSFLQRIVEENIDLEQLILQEGKLAYRLAMTVTILSESSTCITTDACVTAISAALLDTRLPAQPIIRDGVVYSSDDNSDGKALQMQIVPCSLTAAGVQLTKENEDGSQHTWIVHPDAQEELVVDSVLTVIVNAAAGPDNEVLALDLQPRTPLGSVHNGDLARLLHMAVGHAVEFGSILQPPAK